VSGRFASVPSAVSTFLSLVTDYAATSVDLTLNRIPFGAVPGLSGNKRCRQCAGSRLLDEPYRLLDHLHAIRVVLFSHLTTATEAGDGNLAANVAGRLTHVLETIARISCELGALATNTTFNITNNQLVLTQNPAFLKLQASLLQALAPFPEARAAVVAALRELDGDDAHAAVPAFPSQW
jgi:hypothetical protein